MSHSRKPNKVIEAELKALYEQLQEMNKRNNTILGDSMRLFTPQTEAMAEQALGALPQQIEDIKNKIRAIENKYHIEPKLDSPSALNKLKK